MVEVPNTTTPYFEYTHQGLGLVELQATLGTLEQERANGDSEGNFTGLDQFANVNPFDQNTFCSTPREDVASWT